MTNLVSLTCPSLQVFGKTHMEVFMISGYGGDYDFRNTRLVSSRASLTSWGESASLALAGHPSSDGVTIKMPYGVNVLHQRALHLIFSDWVG